MQATRIPGVALWSQWQEDRQVFFNSHFVAGPDGNLLIDPLELSERDAAEIDASGGVAWIVVTNRDHERASAAASQRFGAPIAASALDAPLLWCNVTRTLEDGERIGDARVIVLEGMKSPGEIALEFRSLRTVLVGDALWGAPAGALSLPPRVKDAHAALLSLRRIARIRPEHLLVGDGSSIYDRAYQAIHTFLASRTEAYVNRINLKDLRFDYIGDERPGYGAFDAEVGHLIGASRLGYRVSDLPAGSTFCPMHWHAGDEELCIVWEGVTSLLTPRGEIELRAGDLVAFPAGERGAHKLINRSDTTCRVIFIAYEPDLDVCYYPDSDKLLVSPQGTLVRSSPQLDYYDGEH